MPSPEIIIADLGLPKKVADIALDSVRFRQFLDAVKRGTLELPIKSEVLENMLELQGFEIRGLRAFAQCMGYEVGSVNRGRDSGYFWACDAEELGETERHINSRHRKLGLVLTGIKLTRTRLRGNRPRQESLW